MKTLVATAALALSLVSTAASAASSGKQLTPSQTQTFNELISIGFDEKDAEQVARDPGVKKNEWGWICESGKLKREKGFGTRNKRNAVCE